MGVAMLVSKIFPILYTNFTIYYKNNTNPEPRDIIKEMPGVIYRSVNPGNKEQTNLLALCRTTLGL